MNQKDDLNHSLKTFLAEKAKNVTGKRRQFDPVTV